MVTQQALKTWYEGRFKEILADYFTFLKFPSISTDPSYKKDVTEAARWVKKFLSEVGFQTELWPTAGHPVVFAEHRVGKERPTVLIYHHYDVQPVDPIEKWISPPFEPTMREGAVFARGASDNKGQCFYTLTALKALFELSKQVDLNIKLFIEGEEECGSRGALEVLKTHRDRLKTDHVVIVDSGVLAPDKPAITLGLRGIVALEVTCTNSKIDLHSGIHGGVVLNPNRALVQMLSQLWDETGKVQVPGFYREVEESARLPGDVDRAYLTQQFGIRAFQGEGGYSLLESNTIRPTLELNGISGGYTGEGFKTVIPSQAKAKISCRLVPHQHPDKVAEQISLFLKQIAPAGLEVTVSWDHGGVAVRTAADSPIVEVCADAYSEVFGKPCEKILCGASIPLVAELTEACGGDLAIIGVGLDTDDIHAPNEHFSLKQLEQGFLTMGGILRRLAE